MPQAIWNGQVIAESPTTVVVEGNHYFPRSALNEQFFEASDTRTECGWKGSASYLHVVVQGKRNSDAAWFYSSPKPAAAQIAGHVAFWKGIEVRA